MGMVVYDIEKIDPVDAPIVHYAVSSYGYLVFSQLENKTLGEFADIIEKHYDSKNPVNEMVIKTLRKYAIREDSDKDLFLEIVDYLENKIMPYLNRHTILATDKDAQDLKEPTLRFIQILKEK